MKLNPVKWLMKNVYVLLSDVIAVQVSQQQFLTQDIPLPPTALALSASMYKHM